MTLGLNNRLSFSHTLTEAVFIERPNRFVAVVALPSGEIVKAHVPDPGRLKELFLPKARVLIRDYGADSKRKLRYSLEMVFSAENTWVSVNTQLPNRIVAEMLERKCLPGFEQYSLIKKEFTYGASRFDFLLEGPKQQRCLLEIKSCTLVEQGVALFPDAPTVRGARHLMELVKAIDDGYECRVVFVIQRADPVSFSPNERTDPDLAKALKQAILAGVRVNAFCFELTKQYCQLMGEIPVVIPETV